MAKKVRKTGRPVSPQAFYRKAAEQIRRRIASGEWPPGTIVPSVRVLAEEYDIGLNTAWKALAQLKREGRISANLNRRLVVSGLTSLARVGDQQILYLLGDTLKAVMEQPLTAAITNGVLKGSTELMSPVVLAQGRRYRKRAPVDLAEQDLRGILLGYLPPRSQSFFEKLNIPVVLIDWPLAKSKMHTVSVDNETAAYDATSRFLQRGHRRIAFVRRVSRGQRDIFPDSKERQKGYERAMAEAGSGKRGLSIQTAFQSDNASSPAYQGIFKKSPPVTAVLTVDSECAQVVIAAAQGKGLTVPRDLSVASFQGHPAPMPELSGPRVDFEDMGFRAVVLLKEPKSPPQHIRVAAPWYEGRTVGAPRKS